LFHGTAAAAAAAAAAVAPLPDLKKAKKHPPRVRPSFLYLMTHFSNGVVVSSVVEHMSLSSSSALFHGTAAAAAAAAAPLPDLKKAEKHPPVFFT
jgi:hypothetical protein